MPNIDLWAVAKFLAIVAIVGLLVYAALSLGGVLVNTLAPATQDAAAKMLSGSYRYPGANPPDTYNAISLIRPLLAGLYWGGDPAGPEWDPIGTVKALLRAAFAFLCAALVVRFALRIGIL